MQAKKVRSKYLDWLVQSKCGPDMLANALFPNAKEVTESFACFEATMHLGPGFEWNSSAVSVYVVGDGHKPRTAATFAYRTAWEAHSIDPLLAPRIYNIKRLMLHRRKVEDVEFGSEVALIVMPHSHAPIAACLENIKAATRALITMDCCVNQVLGKAPDVEYADDHVWSPKNVVRVWRSV